jgi:hypothetical protein
MFQFLSKAVIACCLRQHISPLKYHPHTVLTCENYHTCYSNDKHAQECAWTRRLQPTSLAAFASFLESISESCMHQ